MLSIAVVLLMTGTSHGLRLTSGVTTDRPEDFVEVLAGTDMSSDKSNGNTLPQVKRPWGFNDWVPQTAHGLDVDGSFFFSSLQNTFYGLRCTHQPSPWIGDYSYFLLTPHIDQQGHGQLAYSPRGPSTTFKPHYFAADLQPSGSSESMTLEITPTNHAALVRVTFPANEQVGYLSMTLRDGGIQPTSGNTLTGSTDASSGGTPTNWRMHFVLRARGSATWLNRDAQGHEATVMVRRGNSEQLQLTLEVATSFISLEQAQLNLMEVDGRTFADVVEEGRKEWNTALGKVKVSALGNTQLKVFYTNLWKAMLFPRFLTEEGADGSPMHMSPYSGKVSSGRLVTDSGFWDAYHTVYPMLSIIFPDVLGKQIDGWVSSYKEAGWLPTWPSPGQRNSMAGTMGDAVLADAIVKSRLGVLTGFDVDAAYAAIRRDAFDPALEPYGRQGLKDYLDKGYIAESEDFAFDAQIMGDVGRMPASGPAWRRHMPFWKRQEGSGQQVPFRLTPLAMRRERGGASEKEVSITKRLSPSYMTSQDILAGSTPSLSSTGSSAGQAESVSTSLLDYLADAAVANAAEALGRTSEATALRRRSRRYGALFNTTSGFFQPRSPRGTFLPRFDPLAWRDGFTEGSAWHYRFAVPHDVPGLAQLHDSSLCGRIGAMFSATTGDAFHSGGYFGTIHEMVEAREVQRDFGLYNHCNQPSHEVLWIAKKVGCNELANKYLRKVMDKLYTTKGWCGDEDNGEMASWYILSALGLYALEPGKDELVLGSPALVGATVGLPKGRKLIISTVNQAPNNVNVASVTWTPVDGLQRMITGNVIKYSEVMKGGELRFTMAAI